MLLETKQGSSQHFQSEPNKVADECNCLLWLVGNDYSIVLLLDGLILCIIL